MSKKAVIITIVSLGVAGGGIFGGIMAYQNYQQRNLSVEVQYVSNMMGYFGESGMSSSGVVTNDYSQNVYALDDKTITKVFVEEGQEVKAGDPLVSYDMTLSQLELEMKELDVATNSSKMEAAKQRLEKLKKTTPIAPEPEVPDEPDIPDEPEPPQEPEEPQIPELTGEAYNYIRKGTRPNAGMGTEEDPYVYLCMPDCYVLGDFINSLSADKRRPVFVSLEIHKENTMEGKLISAWEINGESGFPQMAEDSRWLVRTRSQVMEPDDADIIEEPDDSEDYYEPEEPEPPRPEGYTAEELAEMIKETEQQIRDLDLDGRKAQLELDQMKKISSDGVIKAEINGVVKSVGEQDEISMSGEPFITVTGSEGLYVSGSLSELQLGEIQVGQKVFANSWESGKSFEATITEISTYPDEDSSVWGDGNPNVSYYPYTAYIEDTEGLRNGEYVDLTMTARRNDSQGDTLYIEKAYVREEDNKKYVLKADENNRLVKQYVKTGKTMWGQYVEIKEGITEEDRLAFPYGKSAKEGVKVKEAE